MPRSIATHALLWMFVLAVTPSAARCQEHDHGQMAGDVSPVTPQLGIHGFFDITLAATRTRHGSADSTSLGSGLGQLDLLLTSRISERISFLGEVVLEAEDNGDSAADVERAYVRYSLSDHLRVSAGRTHAAVSYWYVTSHHGGLLQPTITRPAPVRFEDEPGGGYLPAHAVGLELGGHESLGDVTFSWVANLANGRPARRQQVQTSRDRNQNKQLGMSATLSGSGALEWHAGGALFHDRAANDEGIGPETDQDIANMHLALRHAWFDQVGEYFVVRDLDRTTRIERSNRAWYGVVSLGPGPWRPYVATEGMRMASGDAYYAGLPNMDRVTAGLRYDINAFNVVKLEYRNGTSDGARTHELLLQTAFTF